MDILDVLTAMGGVGDRRALVAATSRAELERAVRGGEMVRAGRGRYVLAQIQDARRDAARFAGVVSHESAALLRGLEVARRPRRPQITLPRHRRTVSGVEVHFADLTPGEVDRGVTTLARTVLDCARTLPYVEALAVVDSALRHGVSREDLLLAVAGSPRTGRGRARRAVESGDPRSANPFESVLRGYALEAGLDVEPQVWIEAISGRPDLVDLG